MTRQRAGRPPVVAVVTRFPQPGLVKTRLEPALGATGAERLHRELAAHCVSRLRPLYATGEATIEVHVDGGSRPSIRRWLGAWPRVRRQGGGDLGDRLRTVLSAAFASGARTAAVVGSDCPGARAIHVRAALRALETHDIVIGPADDGGYWILGLNADAASRALPVLFDGIGWGGSTVCSETLARARAASLDVAVVDRLADVDRPTDIAIWRAEKLHESLGPATVSVVMPALNEERRIAAAVASALDGGAVEVVVVDGGSVDATKEVAEAAGARVIGTAPGRAHQMNLGASAAAGDALLFLHADTRLPAGAAALVVDALAEPGVSGGAFSWGTDDTPLAGLFGWIGRMRMGLFRVPYGDQALFLSRRTFEDLGGYPEQPVMEDWELAQRMRRLGQLRILPEPALTSSRRWNDSGVIRASLTYLAIMAAYRFGVDPYVLDGWREP